MSVGSTQARSPAHQATTGASLRNLPGNLSTELLAAKNLRS
jgi:hypothetical protein